MLARHSFVVLEVGHANTDKCDVRARLLAAKIINFENKKKVCARVMVCICVVPYSHTHSFATVMKYNKKEDKNGGSVLS